MTYKGQTVYLPADILDHVMSHHAQEGDAIADAIRRALGLPVPSRVAVAKPKTKDRRRKYDVTDLEVGQTKKIPWRTKPDGSPHPNQQTITHSIRQYGERTGRKFEFLADAVGVIVQRVI